MGLCLHGIDLRTSVHAFEWYVLAGSHSEDTKKLISLTSACRQSIFRLLLKTLVSSSASILPAGNLF